jgi:hypothetical protein
MPHAVARRLVAAVVAVDLQEAGDFTHRFLRVRSFVA